MIEFNLLPDIKLQYIKARKARRLVTTVAIFVTIGSVILLALTVSVRLYQVKRLSDLNDSIAKNARTLENIPQLNKILTVQNQLQSLTALHDQKPGASLVFDYLNRVTPAQAKISNFTVDFTLHSMTITGTADALSSVNKYVDTLKFTKFATTDNTTARAAFNDVVLSSFGVTENAADPTQKNNYTITLNYDEDIFNTTKSAVLTVPSIISTRSEVAKPSDLFTKSTTQSDANAAAKGN
ncbi:MAG: hypothetical protein JWM81_734 [Candidatus Saccharibacteria bacterium]|nr:hypothetical protein [Candidatus Saccharibacteria bacterium]